MIDAGMPFGEWMKRRRGVLRMTQRSLADAMGYTEIHVRRTEAGDRAPSGPLSQALADTFQIPTELRAAFLTFAKNGKYDRRLDALLGVVQGIEATHRTPTNLPSPPTLLIGRDQVVASVRRLLLRPDVRLVTLTGPGGTGKTRIGVQVAADLRDHFHSGVWFVDLAPISEPDLMVTALARVLGVRQQGARRLADSVTDALQNKAALLLLDNFEQLLPAVDASLDAARQLVADILGYCPRVKILVTSRERLRLRGEKRVEIPPLAVPDLKSPDSLANLAQFDAVRLFVERAQDVEPEFSLSYQNALSVAEICVRLDGLPLAIEIAAPRILDFAPYDMLRALGQSGLEFLRGGPVDLPARQRTMRHTIAWSYHLLHEADQALLRRLAVFVGGCSLPAIEAVLGNGETKTGEAALDPLPSPQALQANLQSLVQKNLVKWMVDTTGARRLVLAETIREFAWEQLRAQGEDRVLRAHHAAHFVHVAEKEQNAAKGSVVADALERLDIDFANLRAALDWYAMEAENVEPGLCLAGALWQYWYTRGNPAEASGHLERLLSRIEVRTTLNHALALVVAGGVAYFLTDDEMARRYWKEALSIRRTLGDLEGEAKTLANLGVLEIEQGHYSDALATLEQALCICQEQGFTKVGGRIHQDIGYLALKFGDDTLADKHLTASIAILEEMRDEWNLAYIYLHFAQLAILRRETSEVRRRFNQCLTLFQKLDDRRGSAMALEAGARFALDLEQPEKAVKLLGAAEAVRKAIGAPLPPADLPNHMTLIEEIRHKMSPGAFEAGWHAGQSIALKQALEIASSL